MMLRESHTTVIVPGLRRHVDDHWQTRLAAKLPGAVVVPSFDRDKRDLAGRVADLNQVILDAGAPVTIVAHSAGVLTTVHWARQHDLPVRRGPPGHAARPGPAPSCGVPLPRRSSRSPAGCPSPATAAVPQHPGGQHERRARATWNGCGPWPTRGAAGSSTSDRSAT